MTLTTIVTFTSRVLLTNRPSLLGALKWEDVVKKSSIRQLNELQQGRLRTVTTRTVPHFLPVTWGSIT